jgi:hypothetical protein
MTTLIHSLKRVVPADLKQLYWSTKDKLAVSQLKASEVSRQEFIADIRNALAEHRGFAAAKIGVTASARMYYEIFLSKRRSPQELADYEEKLRFSGLKQEGLFPVTAAFLHDYNRFYVKHLRNLDSLGVCHDWSAGRLLTNIKYYGLTSKLIYYPLQEPDRSIPSNEANCYLPLFKNKRVLIVCPFAGYLRERATKETYERAWSKIGKPWFYPASVDAIEFPYGFARSTHERYATVLDLLNEIQNEISRQEFDVALVGAAGLAIPLVSYMKGLGKVAIDLGGALQFMFGVSGKRWQAWQDLKQNIFNDHWTHLPAKYRPQEEDVCDNGAYW